MGTYFLQTPFWLPLLYPSMIWKNNSANKNIVLTFDDGPHPIITKEVLQILNEYKVKAHFFCVGNNVVKYPEMFQEILANGHQVGNHTFHHVNGWKTETQKYVADFMETEQVFSSQFFRPPYGKISFQQINQLKSKTKMVMWSRLSGDFDKNISKEKCLENCIRKPLRSNEIIVFHDSEKAYSNMIFALPKFIEHALEKGFSFELLK